MKLLSKLFAIGLVAVITISTAGDDPSIKGKLREEIHKSMQTHVKNHVVNGKYIIYDAAVNKLRTLSLDKLHTGIVKKGQFFVSCADFSDAKGLKYDLDFLVIKNGEKYQVNQTIVHKVNGDKRPYTIK